MLTTKVKVGVVGYDGINIYDEDGRYLGKVTLTNVSKGGGTLCVDVKGLDIKPRALDLEDSSHQVEDDYS